MKLKLIVSFLLFLPPSSFSFLLPSASCPLPQSDNSRCREKSDITGVLHILIGTYELLEFRNLSGQASRRGLDIHFPRYLYQNEQDRLDFQSTLLASSIVQNTVADATESTTENPKTPKKSGTRVGQRKPKRDPVGHESQSVRI